MEIRTGTAGDIDALVEFNQAMALETEGKTLDTEILKAGVSAVLDDSDKGFYVVADISGSVAAGLMVTREWSDWRDGWFWWIQSVYVRPEHRSKGLYREMYEFVKRRAAADGNVCGFRLYVEKQNQAAQAVYKKLGMNETYYLLFEEETKNRGS